ncbi:S8 family serine peptidase [Spirillospora sp. NPDC048819]|uniref:S8 family peptidase n=1 Tax=Spirillospora sp. NPDC048819 TaxID=3155268 RepID=UPI0033E579BD
MSEAGRRRPARTRPATRLGARTTAALTVLTLGAAVAVPVAVATGDRRQPERTVRGAAAGALLNAPTDQIRAREWHLEALRTQKAWKYSKGRGVTVAVLDTGVDKNHPDLTGQVLTGPDLTGGVRSPGTRYWGLHGTSMASIISGHGHGPRLSQGMMGVAPQSHILSIRVTLENDDPLRRDNGQGGSSDRDAVAQGIRYAVDHGADIINMSLGGGRQFYNGTKSQESAIKYALDKGVVLIASAGNDGSGANRKNFPAAYPGVIAVGALDRRLRLWKDSNRRSHAAVCAPGVDIVSADASNGYVVGTGTSASSAMVAGVAALVRSRYPRLTPAEVREALIQGSPARRGRPTGSSTCQGTVDALLTLFAAHKINKTSSGPVEAPPPSPSPEPVAQVQGEGSDLLLPLVLAGGGLLVVLGLVLGWRQRRRPEDDTGDTDAVPDYGLPSAPPAQRHPAAAVVVPRRSAAVAPVVAPVNAPLWQSTDVYQGPPAPAVPPGNAPPFEISPFDVPPYDIPPSAVPGGERSPWDGTPMDEPPMETPSMETPSMDTSSWGSSWDTEAPPDRDEPPPPAPHQPPIMSSELRPFVPGEYSANGRSGGHANGQGHLNGYGFTNGHKPANGHDFGNGHHDNGNGAGDTDLNGADLNGSGVDGLAGDDVSGLDDDDWEAFRRNALDGHEPPDIGLTAPLPAVPPEPPAQPPPPPGPPVPPVDEWPTGALPAVPPDPADGEPPRGPVPPMDQADDEPRGRHSRRSGPSDDEDYRPPWW